MEISIFLTTEELNRIQLLLEEAMTDCHYWNRDGFFLLKGLKERIAQQLQHANAVILSDEEWQVVLLVIIRFNEDQLTGLERKIAKQLNSTQAQEELKVS